VPAALERDALLPRADARLGLGALLALLAHGGLVGALALGLNWRLPQPDVLASAELWAAVPQVAAPPPAPTPAPTPPPPERRPEPAPPKPVPPKPVEADRDAEIALEKAAKRKKEQQAAREAAEREKRAQEKALLLKKAAEDKRLADEKIAQRQRQAALEDQRKQAQEAALQDANTAKLREENLKRMLGQAGATGAANATGNAARDAAPSAAYAGRIKARIKPNIVLTQEVVGNPIAEVEVRCAPDGSIVGRRIIKTSGNPVWDDTVLRAIDRTAKLPLDNGQILPTMILVFPRQE
jgi:colicin import membrane protein